MAKHEAEKELETKIIKFPTPMRVAYKAKVKQVHTYEVRPGAVENAVERFFA